MAVAEIVDDIIHVDTEWNEKDSIKKVPGSSWNADLKIWEVNLTWAACIQLRGIFGKRLDLGPGLHGWGVKERKTRIAPALALRDLTALPADTWAGNPLLYDFQRAGVEFLRTAGSALLADEMGTGKTIQTLETLRLEDALPAVVVCPKSMMGTWKREAGVWYPAARPYTVTGTAIQRRKILLRAAQDPQALVIINFEGVRAHSRLKGFGSTPLKRCQKCAKAGFVGVSAATCEAHPRELNEFVFKSVIVDEAHRLKDPKAKQTRAVWALGDTPGVERRIALTGTPLASHPGDLWAILHFIAPLSFPTKSKYVDRYCEAAFNQWGGLDIGGVNKANEAELFKIIDPMFRRMPKALVLQQLPKKVPVRRYVKLDDKQLKAYKQLEDNLITRLDDGSVLIAKSGLVAATRLLQFSSSYMEQGEPRKVVDKVTGEVTFVDTWRMIENSPKLDAMEEIIDEMGGKSVVFCAESRQLIEMAEKRLVKAGITYAMITGNTAQWERESQLRDFQAGKLQVMLFTIKAGGVGLTMTAADTIVFLQRSWSMIDNKQAEDRVHRIGSEIHDSITVIDIVAEETVELDQIDRLWRKAERLEEITRDRAKLEAAGLSTAHLDKEEAALLESHLGDPS